MQKGRGMTLERHIEVLRFAAAYAQKTGKVEEYSRFLELIGFLEELKSRREAESLWKSTMKGDK